ncbi:hypothetical protein B0H19DRAFT_1257071 [Mycena capillaripes]|nr:hypothetical protein B0H19DRAFT_1257071 [Mycena capillaripes]
MQRPVISYDDITLPYSSPDPPRASTGNQNSPSGPSQSKKRKWSNQKQGNKNNGKAPANGPVAEEEAAGDDEEDADSRYLTTEEIWDDSALIDAWNAATEEYEALNGPEKGWKNEPVHKSPLWYNVPPTKPPNKKLKTDAAGDSALPPAEGDSTPLDFDTFVPSYDASLALPVPESARYDYSTLPPPGVGVATQDEAFTRALGAMYWGGYWTAVYHCHRSAQRAEGEGADDGDAGEGEEEEDEDGEDGGEYAEEDEEEAFVPTQR